LLKQWTRAFRGPYLSTVFGPWCVFVCCCHSMLAPWHPARLCHPMCVVSLALWRAFWLDCAAFWSWCPFIGCYRLSPSLPRLASVWPCCPWLRFVLVVAFLSRLICSTIQECDGLCCGRIRHARPCVFMMPAHDGWGQLELQPLWQQSDGRPLHACLWGICTTK
jgi:hypothetical protein